MTRHPVYLASANLIAAAFRARARGMTGDEARALLAAESTRIPEGHRLAAALAAFARDVGLAHGNALRIKAAAEALHRAASLAMLPEMPARVDIYG
ncbi:MAG: hypothetical protein ACRCYS_09315 [Beijerinckiaceae bacterium]